MHEYGLLKDVQDQLKELGMTVALNGGRAHDGTLKNVFRNVSWRLHKEKQRRSKLPVKRFSQNSFYRWERWW